MYVQFLVEKKDFNVVPQPFRPEDCCVEMDGKFYQMVTKSLFAPTTQEILGDLAYAKQ